LSDTVRIVKYNILNYQEILLGEVKLDSNGVGTIAFDLDAPSLAAIRVKPQNNPAPINNELTCLLAMHCK
jgi:hypothetical protein